eukprot:573487-Pelagomonas_calceolata.AAC.7
MFYIASAACQLPDIREDADETTSQSIVGHQKTALGAATLSTSSSLRWFGTWPSVKERQLTWRTPDWTCKGKYAKQTDFIWAEIAYVRNIHTKG